MEYDVLFRGKRVDNGQWVYGWYCKYAFRACIIPSEEAENGCVEHVQVDPATVGQYTGTTDKNGIKIFDGDILSGVCNRRNKEYFEVRWSKGNCGFVAGRGVHIRPNMNQATMDAYEVAGNIHDNPELLEERSL